MPLSVPPIVLHSRIRWRVACPRHSSLYLEQEDSTFGSNVYQADFGFDGVSIVMQVENLTTMWWGILPLVAEGDFRSVVTITPTDRGLLFYASAAIHAADLDFARERAQTSLGNRLDALEGWLRLRLAEESARSLRDTGERRAGMSATFW